MKNLIVLPFVILCLLSCKGRGLESQVLANGNERVSELRCSGVERGTNANLSFTISSFDAKTYELAVSYKNENKKTVKDLKCEFAGAQHDKNELFVCEKVVGEYPRRSTLGYYSQLENKVLEGLRRPSENDRYTYFKDTIVEFRFYGLSVGAFAEVNKLDYTPIQNIECQIQYFKGSSNTAG